VEKYMIATAEYNLKAEKKLNHDSSCMLCEIVGSCGVMVGGIDAPQPRCAAEHPLPITGGGATICTAETLQKAHLLLAGGGGFSVRIAR
jgi:hypothetical protein